MKGILYHAHVRKDIPSLNATYMHRTITGATPFEAARVSELEFL